MKILVINPGSTSTKIAVFEDKEVIFENKIDHAQDKIFQEKFSKPGDIFDQFEYRYKCVADILKETYCKRKLLPFFRDNFFVSSSILLLILLHLLHFYVTGLPASRVTGPASVSFSTVFMEIRVFMQQ